MFNSVLARNGVRAVHSRKSEDSFKRVDVFYRLVTIFFSERGPGGHPVLFLGPFMRFVRADAGYQLFTQAQMQKLVWALVPETLF